MTKGLKIKSILIFAFVAVLFFALLVFSLSFTGVTASAVEPEQTYNLHSISDFCGYAREYASGNRNPKDVLVLAYTSDSALTDETFISLGTSDRPFAGTIYIPRAGINTFHLSNCPLFDYLSTDAKLLYNGTTSNALVEIMRGQASETPSEGVLTTGAAFANHVVNGTAAASWEVSLLAYSGEGVAATTHQGLIGDIADNASVTISLNNASSLSASGSGAVGMICGTLGAGASLTVSTSGTGTALSVTSTGDCAGGLVGKMLDGATLTLASVNNSRVGTVTGADCAGGIVGSAINPTVSFGAGVASYAVTADITGTNNAGGVFGYYKTQSASGTFSMLKYTLSGVSVSSSNYAGGVFGYLDSECASLTFDGEASLGKSFSFTLPSGKGRGGVAGRFRASNLTNVFEITDADITVAASVDQPSGALIGILTNDPAYLTIHDVEVTSSGSAAGGLIGSIGEGGSFVDVRDVVVSGSFDAGLIGNLPEGVLRIQGETDFSAYLQNSSGSGLIVKNRSRALIYALGSGSDSGWLLKRNTSNGIDDVRGWGEVLRVDGTLLAESDLFTVDSTAHTVTLKAAVTSIGTVTQFALTALNIQLNTTTAKGALLYTSGNANKSATLLSGTLTLTADISLAGTGLTGFARDNGGNNAFTGSFDGGNNVLTLAIGEIYGRDGNGAALSSGGRYGVIHRHEYNGLFAEIGGGASVENVTISGTINVYQTAERTGDAAYAGALAAYCSGSLSLDNVTIDTTLLYKTGGDYSFLFGGAIGNADGNSLSITVTDCDIHPTVTDATGASPTARTVSMQAGGLIGRLGIGGVASPSQSVSVTNTNLGLTYSKTGNNTARESVFGGVIATIANSIYVKDRRTVSINNVALTMSVTSGTAAGGRFGGLLGTDWYACDVTVDGLTVTASVAATGSQTDFGGLTQNATGRWDIIDLALTSASYTLPNNGSTFGFVANKSYVSSTVGSATSQTALYVDVNSAAYDISALTFTSNPAFSSYDEIVASSLGSANNLTQNGNSIVSITTSGNVIDTSGSAYNTYLNQTAYGRASGVVNPNTRYYYNLAYARANLSTAKYKFLIWSVKQYAHSSLSAWFNTDSTFTGSLDMTGLSYYPVDFSGSITITSATIVLNNILTESSVYYAYRYTDNGLQTSTARTTRNNTNQHYLMHTSLFRNAVGSITIDGATLAGNVPKLSNTSCGFLVAGTLGGSDSTKANCSLSGIVLSGLYISTGNNHFTDVTYAPVVFNKVGKNTVLDLDGASGASYSSYAASGYYAGSSLIGDVGDATARAIYMTFNAIVFDSRTTTTPIDNMDTVYDTEKTVFSRATLLNSLMYFGESSARYNFTIEEDRTSALTATHSVTYGREITSSSENADKQKKYYSSNYFVHPTAFESGTEYDFSSGFLPYVYVAYNLSEYKHEVAINVTFSSVIEGCGKYGDPFVIDDDDKLPILSGIIAGNDVGNTVQLHLPSDLTSFDYTGTSYTKYLYNFDTATLTSSDGGADQANDDVRRYVAGAYFVITRDVTLSHDFVALGTTTSAEYAFRGVIIGSGNPVITNTSRNPLIYSSNGCVVKGVTVEVDVDSTYFGSDTIELAAPLGSDTYAYDGGIQAYGAVIGQVMGGDTFIDNVQVTFRGVTFSVTTRGESYYPTLTPIGGYIGVVVNGGVVFRNMTASNVGLTASTYSRVGSSAYLYVNPIIGRVIAGYAFTEAAQYHATEEDATLKNGEKNYTISDLSLSAGKLNVEYSSNQFTITVPDGQAMFVLGAIVNSGAASAAYNASTVNPYQGLTAYWSAYSAHMMARAGAAYSYVGESGFDSSSDFTDYAVNDEYTATLAKTPYIIRAYSNKTGDVYLARCISSKTDSKIVVSGDCDVAQGFRGIGSIYTDSDYVRLGVRSVSGQVGNTTASRKVTLHMRYLEYNHKSVSSYISYASASNNASGAGFGLFTRLTTNSASSSNSVQYLTLAGSIFYDVYTISGEQAKYNFAAFKDNDRSEKKDLVNAYNTEDATMRRTILSVGGIAGFVYNKCYIKNVTFDDFSVEGAKNAGGLIGLLYTNQNTSAHLCTIAYDSGVENTGYVNVVGGQCAGGLVGRIYLSSLQIVGASGGTDLIVKTVESKDSDPNEIHLTYLANLNTGVGGVVGNCWGSDKSGYAYPSSITASYENKGQNELIINNINVVKGNTVATIRVRNDQSGDQDDRYNYAGGFVGSAHYVYLKLTDSHLKCVNVTANAAGGFVGKLTQHYYLEVFNCSANGSSTENGTSKDASIVGTRHAGGVVGWAIGRDKVYFQLRDFIVKNYLVESSTRKNSVIAGAGGILGYAEGNNVAVSDARNVICQFNNLTVLNCDIKTNYTNKTDNYLKYKCGTGGIIGVIDALNNSDGKGDPNEAGRVASLSNTSNKYKFSGYNILVKDSTFTHLNGGTTNDSTSSTNRRIGDIVGNNAVYTTIKFVGVSLQNATYCGKHVGSCDNDNDNYGSDSSFGTGYLVLADYSGATTNQRFSGIDDTSVNTDNYNNVTVAYPYVTANPSLQIGGMTLTGDGIAANVDSLPIQNIISDGVTGRYGYAAKAYYQGSSGDTNLSAFNVQKLVMFTSEASSYLGTNFPVLLVDDTTRANSHKMINSYLRLLTNTVHDFGTDVASLYSVVIYNVTYANGVFTPHATGASLKRTNGEFYVTNTAFDSGKIQFSLIDLRFFNPADGATVAYHVYVPVFVKKVLSYSFDIAVQSGTSYLESGYTNQFGEALIENVGTPVTLYFSYSYSRPVSEWASAINMGEDVHRNYEKRLYFYKANTNEILSDFPSDTVLVLVDKNRGGKAYYSTIGTALSGTTLVLSSFYETMSPAGVLGGNAFSPVNLEDMMTLSVTQNGGGTDKMVTCAVGQATVVVAGQGYRLATDEELSDDSVQKYTITASGSEFSERYYLSVFTKSNAVNDLLFHYFLITTPTTFGDSNHPSKIADTGSHTMVHLVMGKIFYHDGLSVDSDSLLGSQVMTAENNELTVTLRTVLGLNDDLGEELVANVSSLIGATEVYQSFLVYLNRKEGSEVLRAIIGDPEVSGEYAVDYTLNSTPDTAATSYAAANIRMTQNHVEVVTGNISNRFTTGNKFEINAVITISYGETAIPTQFPGRGITSPDSGVTVSASSNVAFSSVGTTYSKNTIGADETPAVSYYSEADPVVAVLDLNPIGDKVGNFTALGINALNIGNNETTATFDLYAVIDATAVEEFITGYQAVEISVKLQQKSNEGTYGDLLDVSEYFTVAFKGVNTPPTDDNTEDTPLISVLDNDTEYTALISVSDGVLVDNGAEITLPLIQVTVKTGSALEAAGLAYSNYRVVVEAVLLNDQGGEIAVSRVSNYIVYTNAKVVPNFVV